jgi:RNA ligase
MVNQFKRIEHIDDIRSAVTGKEEIKYILQPNGTTIVCYMFQDSHTFDTPEAIECRGIAFGSDGKIVSRPLHKFFNMGEKAWLTPDELLKRDDVVAIYDKLDGSMIATSYHNGKLEFRS